MLVTKEHYNNVYYQKNYFQYKESLFSSYIKGLVAQADLKIGSTLLDVGCGQGFFSYLFHKCGIRVIGIDISETAIFLAQRIYGNLGIEFIIGDIMNLNFKRKFDCVFTRSFSLYNTHDFPMKHDVTDILLSHVKNGGTFIFAYNTKLSKSKESKYWIYHTFNDVKKHFSCYGNPKIFFINKVDAIMMRKFAFNVLITKINILISKALGLGGDLVCILKK